MRERATVTLSTILVDDEELARDELKFLLEDFPEVDVIGTGSNGLEALDLVTQLDPDLLFLDVQMPGLDGVGVVRKIREKGLPVPHVVFSTAYDQYAVEAFRLEALDYLLKPVSPARLKQSLERARKLLGTQSGAAENLAKLQEAAAPAATRSPRKIVGKLGEEYFLLNAAEVLAFQADGEIVWIVTAKQRFVATQSLRSIEGKLAGSSFRRVHRNALVNVDHVRKLSALSSNRWLITLTNQQEFIVSKRMARNVRQILTW